MEKNLNLSYTIAAPMQQIFSLFNDLKSFGSIHPIITEVKTLENGKSKITESIAIFMGFKLKTSYTASIIFSELNKRIIYEAHPSFLNLKIEFSFLKAENDSTTIIENVVIKGPAILAIFLKKTLAKSHTQLFEKLVKRFSAKT